MITALAMSTFAVAGGDIAPVEPEVTLPEVVEESTGAFYVGIAYGMVNTETSFTERLGSISGGFDIDHSTIMFQAGYQFNKYLALEGRYWTAVSDAEVIVSYADGSDPKVDLNDDSNAWGIYVKPMYPVTSSLNAYALLGYGNVEIDIEDISADESGFQWGLGASYAINDNFAVFVDYMSMYDDNAMILTRDHDVEIDSWNFGLTYTF